MEFTKKETEEEKRKRKNREKLDADDDDNSALEIIVETAFDATSDYFD